MAQGSFASRIFHKYCKTSQEHRGQESEPPRISEFTIMWDKLSKCSVLPSRLKYVGRPLPPWAGLSLHSQLFASETTDKDFTGLFKMSLSRCRPCVLSAYSTVLMRCRDLNPQSEFHNLNCVESHLTFLIMLAVAVFAHRLDAQERSINAAEA